MTEAQPARQVRIVSRWDASRVLFTFDAPEGLESGLWLRAALEAAAESGANLRDANLRGADLSTIKADFFDVLLRAPREIAALREALLAGKVDGSTYEGSCACLVGTIANVRGANYQMLGSGLKPDSSRPIERFFMGIRRGDTPETNSAAKIAVEWVDEFAALMRDAAATFAGA